MENMNSNVGDQISQQKLEIDGMNKSQEYKNLSIDEFATILPQWDLLPPIMVIRRVKRSI